MDGINELKRFSILYVDDEKMALKYFTQTFSKTFDVITTDSVESARQILKEKSGEIAILITDQRMPNEMGTKLLQHVKNEYPDIIRFLTTAYTDIKDAIDAVNNGEIYRYVTKPWDIKELNEQLHNAIHLYLTRLHEQELLNEKRRAMFQLAGNIAHELRTPLLSIKSAANGTDNYLPKLIEIYKKAKEQDPSLVDIRASHLEKIQNTLKDIMNESQHSLTIIDMLMVNAAGEHGNPDSFSTHSMRTCINETLKRYPFKNGQDDIVSFSGENDFHFYGSDILMTHVFFNLIKNALYAISANSNNGKIEIRLEQGNQYNCVYFRDEGTGIDQNILPYIFGDFYSTKSTGLGNNVGLGLSFCKNTIESFDGHIVCKSQLGTYTEFTLKLPVISENK
mgnify:CR=1 FL=1